FAYASDNFHGAFELLHQHDAEDDVGGVVTAGHAKPRRVPDGDLGDVGQEHRHAALLGQHDVAHVLERADDADAAHVDLLLPHRDGPAADVGVPGRDRRHDLRQGQAVGHHLVEVDLGLILLGLAAEHRHVGNAGHNAQLALHDPVLQRLQRDEVHAGWTFE